MRIRHGFNLIEIALAVAVIAVGISSVMVLFPVGLNATAEATADSNIPDAVEYMMTYLEAGTLAAWKDKNEPGYSVADKDNDNEFLKDFEEDMNSVEKADSFTRLANDVFGRSAQSGSLFKIKDEKDEKDEKGKYKKSLFLFQQNNDANDDAEASGVTGFSAIFRVTKNPVSMVYNSSNRKVEYEPGSNSSNYDNGVTYIVEMSYPAEQKYEFRNKLIYRMDVYNQAKLNVQSDQ